MVGECDGAKGRFAQSGVQARGFLSSRRAHAPRTRSQPHVRRRLVLDCCSVAWRRRTRARLGCRRGHLGSREAPWRSVVIPARRHRSPHGSRHHPRSCATSAERCTSRSGIAVQGGLGAGQGEVEIESHKLQVASSELRRRLVCHLKLVPCNSDYDFASFQFSPTPTSTSSGTFSGTAPAIRSRTRLTTSST